MGILSPIVVLCKGNGIKVVRKECAEELCKHLQLGVHRLLPARIHAALVIQSGESEL